MLQSIEIHNFSCIRNLSVSLEFAEGKAPNGYRNLSQHVFLLAGKTPESRLCPVLALYGPNASGKTSILRAVSVLKNVVRQGWHPEAFDADRFVEMPEDVSRIGLRFWKGGKFYFYGLGIASDGIVDERLECQGQVIFCAEKGRLQELGPSFEQQKNDVQSLFEIRCIDAFTGKHTNAIVSEFAQAAPWLSKESVDACEFILSDLISVERNVDICTAIELLASTFTGTTQSCRRAALDQLSNYLKKLDLPIAGLSFAGNGAGAGDVCVIKALHKKKSGEEVWFDLRTESEGTQRLIGLLGVLLTTVRCGKTVLIDDLDLSLHSLLVQELVKLFKEKWINENGAQMVATLHNTDLLSSDLLSLSEIGILKRQDAAGVRIKRLVEFSGLRNGSDFRRRYLRGDFGGIPFPCV